MKLLYLRTVVVCALFGCHRQPLPVLSVPAITERSEVVPAAPLSTLTIALSVPLAALQELAQQRLQIPGEADWRTVTGDGESPELGIRYQAELATPLLRSEGQTLRTSLPFRYHGSFRARAKTPFGWIWLTKNTRWGSREQPGTIELMISSQLSVDGNWQLSAHSTLTDVALTAPDVDKLCAGKVFKVCVPVEMVRERVHRELEQQVRARAEPGLAELDAQLPARVDLPALARDVWQRLSAGLAKNGETLGLAPEGMSLGAPTVMEDAVVAELRIWGRPRWSREPLPAASPLPPPTELGQGSNDLHFTVMASLDELSQGLSVGLAGAAQTGADYRLSTVQLLGPAASAQRFLLAITITDGDSSALAYGEASLLIDGQSVGLSDLQLFADSQPLLAAAGYSPAALVATFSALRHSLTPQLDDRLNGLRNLLASSVLPWPVSPLAGVKATLQAAYVTGSTLTFSVTAR